MIFQRFVDNLANKYLQYAILIKYKQKSIHHLKIASYRTMQYKYVHYYC